MRYRIVDVFTDRPFRGNGLCVVLDPCPEELMPLIAREANLSESTFPVVTADQEYRMRIFTPAGELPFAGHPSIGTAWVLGNGRWTQVTSGATVTVEATAEGAVMTQPDPVLTEVDPQGMAAALGLPGIEGAWLSEAGGTRHVLIPTSAQLGELSPDLAAVARLAARAGGISLCPFRRVDDSLLHVRVFVPSAGIAEDPGTGSAAGPIGLLARRLWATNAGVTIRQGDEIGRACRIQVSAVEGDVRVGGRVAAAAEGRWLP
ncbi:MAG TPA: PhzF family phenazine biosynthesis protein [Actinomycetota bacterium]|nr:PhzF family phenazine biosynthesis protein [Actinomycetota bacterium]